MRVEQRVAPPDADADLHRSTSMLARPIPRANTSGRRSRPQGPFEVGEEIGDGFEAGQEELKSFLSEIGIDQESYNFVDGSGLARLNLVTPAAR